MNLLQPQWLWMLAALVPLVAAALATRSLGRSALRRFFGSAEPNAWSGLATPARHGFRVLLLLLAFAAVTGGLARPAHSPTPKPVQRPAREVVFIIDVSRSMLARDVRPNRLDRAKLAVSDAMEAVRGERVGIVAFAGTAVVKSPLTTDLGFARLALDSLSPDSVSRGGTAIGDAIRVALELLDVDENAEAADTEPTFRDIVLITDGEDHESNPIAAAQAAAKAGVRIIAVGLGSDLSGANIPSDAGGSVQEYEGSPVTTRQNPEALKELAQSTPGGQFFNVGTGWIEMDRVYARLMRDRGRTLTDLTPAVRWSESFQWLLGLALACLCIEPLLSSIGIRRRSA